MQSSSSTCLLASSSTHQPSSKNWEASFGQLASSYGFSGGVPSLPKKTKSTKSDAKTSRASIYTTTPSSSESRATRDYEAAFGHLLSAYGFGGGVPSLPSKASKSSKTTSPSSTSSMASRSSKDYQSAYGDLSSAYGFGAPGPSKS
ncbi:hypothetical protein CVT25_003072 [Psilocybe cyanescens]|uniref:Uncharacterized protein n=1 Tax=Psilocybe cyanescens TaxID=93625 RepID=A0A409X4P0_PSICY|nr:hypothetical protein CVT25_003072 [Psilocybe cyanescens]